MNTTTNTYAIACSRLNMADEALAEIAEASRAMLRIISERCNDHGVCMLSRGMLSRIKALSDIAAECIGVDDELGRTDHEILRELTGLPVATPEPPESTGDAEQDGRQLQGGVAFYEMLREMEDAPDVLRQGFASPEDSNDSMELDYGTALDLFLAYLARCGITIAEPDLAGGFLACLVRHLHTEIKGLSIDMGDSPEDDARKALAEVADARLGTPVAKPEQAADPAR